MPAMGFAPIAVELESIADRSYPDAAKYRRASDGQREPQQVEHEEGSLASPVPEEPAREPWDQGRDRGAEPAVAAGARDPFQAARPAWGGKRAQEAFMETLPRYAVSPLRSGTQ